MNLGMNSGTIEINRLRLKAYHGVTEQERLVGNLFEVTVRLAYPIEGAMDTDEISGTLDYAEAIEIIKQTMSTPSRLLENVAGRLKEALLKRFPLIEGGKITIAKLSPPVSAQAESVAVSLRW